MISLITISLCSANRFVTPGEGDAGYNHLPAGAEGSLPFKRFSNFTPSNTLSPAPRRKHLSPGRTVKPRSLVLSVRNPPAYNVWPSNVNRPPPLETMLQPESV